MKCHWTMNIGANKIRTLFHVGYSQQITFASIKSYCPTEIKTIWNTKGTGNKTHKNHIAKKNISDMKMQMHPFHILLDHICNYTERCKT